MVLFLGQYPANTHYCEVKMASDGEDGNRLRDFFF